MAKDRTPLDIDAALADDVPISIPTGGGETVVREPLDLSVVEDAGTEEAAPVATDGRPEGVPAEAVEQSPGLWMWHEGNSDDPSSVRQLYKPPLGRAIAENIESIPGAILSGAGKALKATGGAIVDAKGWVQNQLTDVMFGGRVDSRSFTEQESKAYEKASSEILSPIIKEQKTIVGNITQSTTQFVVGMVGAAKFTKAIGLLQGAGRLVGFGKTAVQGAIADATVFDPTEERLSNLIEEHTSLGTPVTEYLAAAPDDTRAEGRFKNALEGLVLGSAVESLFVAVRGIKRVRAARASGNPKAAEEELAKLGDELEATQKVADTAPAPKAATDASGVTPPAKVNIGDTVKAHDRDNFGKIQEIKGGKILVHFKNPESGAEATKWFSPEELSNQTGIKYKPEDFGISKEVVEAAKPNVPAPDQAIKDYMTYRLQKGADLEPSYSADFNLAKQSTTAGAKETINLMSHAMAADIDALKGGVQTLEKIKAMAARVGEDPQALLARMSSRAANANTLAADVVATEEWMISTARAISEEAKRLDNGLVTDPTFLNQMWDNLSSTLADLKAVKTGSARATTAGRIVKREGFSLEQIKALVATGGDLDQVIPIIKGPGLLKRGLNAHNEYWINALLSGPKTHLVNSTSNLLNTFARPTEKILGGHMREGLHEFMGIALSIKDSLKMAKKAMFMEESILDPRNLKTEGPRFAISSGNFKLNPKSFMGASIDWLGKAVRLPTRLLMSEDEFFKQLNYRSNVYARATREGVEKNLDGKALADYIETRFASAFDETGKGMDDVALHESRVATFTEDLDPNGLIGKLNKVANQHPGVRLIVPFIRTPTNIVRQLGHRTPGINLLMKSYREELAAGGSRAAAAKGKWATGGMLWGGGILLASEGKLTGRGPENADERAALLATGWRPYSFKTAEGTYLDYSRLDPFGMALGLAADFTEARGYMSDADAEDVALAMGAALSRNLTSKTYLRGITETLDALSQPDRKAEHWLQSRAGSYVPSGAKQIAGLFPGADDTMREVSSMLDAIKARTPGLSQTLPPKRDILGQPIKYPPGLGPDSISPIAVSKDLNDPVRDELARLSYGFKKRSNMVGNVDLTKFKNAKGQDAYDRVQELMTIERKGRYTMAERIARLIESDSYQKLPDGNDEYSSKKLKKVQEIIGEYHIQTLKRLQEEFPEVKAAIKADKTNARVVPRKGLEALKPLLGQ